MYFCSLTNYFEPPRFVHLSNKLCITNKKNLKCLTIISKLLSFMIILVLIIKCRMAYAKKKVKKACQDIFTSTVSSRIHDTCKRTFKLYILWREKHVIRFIKNWKWNMHFTSIICKQKYLSASFNKIFLTFLLLNTNYEIIKFMSALNSLLWLFLKQL